MVYSYFFLALMAISLSHFTSATNRNSPPAGSLTVGSSGTYKTISAAVAAASEGDSIFVYAGTYKEAVYITVDNLKIYGQTEKCAIFILGDNQVVYTHLTRRWWNKKHIILHVEHSHHNIWWLSGNERE